jgi:Uma2 family endonuclease
VEVLSEDSTAREDRTTKFDLYKQCASLETYILLSQTEIEATVFRRATGWQAEIFTRDMEIPLGNGKALRLADAYRGLFISEEDEENLF